MLETRKGRATLFLVMACFGAWSLVWAFARGGGDWGQGTGMGRFVYILHMFPPVLAALMVQGPILRRPLRRELGLSLDPNRYWLVGWTLPLAVLLASLLVASVWPGVTLFLPWDDMPGLLASALFMGLSFNLFGGLAEELGFRGFLLKEVAGGFWTKSTVVGLCWALYLAPAVSQGMILGGDPLQSVLMVTLWCVVTSALVTWVRLRAGSVLAAAAFRGTLLSLTNVAFTLVRSDDALARPMHGAIGVAGAALVLLAIYLWERFRADEPIMARRDPGRATARAATAP